MFKKCILIITITVTLSSCWLSNPKDNPYDPDNFSLPVTISSWLDDGVNQPVITAATPGSFTVSWPQITGAVKYEISDVASWSPFTTVNNVETVSSSYTFSCDPDLNINHYIRARNSSGEEICAKRIYGYFSLQSSNIQQFQSGTYTDDFKDGAIGSAYYKYIFTGGNSSDITEASGYMEFNVTVTDKIPLLFMKYNANSKRYISIKYKNYHHKTNDYYDTGLCISNYTNNNHQFWVRFCCHYNYTPDMVGTVIAVDDQSNTGSYIINQFSSTELFDQWFDGRLVIDRSDKVIKVYIDGAQVGSDYTLPIAWEIENELVLVWGHGGWNTGHMSRIDDLEIKSADILSELGL